MAYLDTGDLYRRIKAEIIEVITAEDSSLVDTAIATGISQAKSYLMRFDLLALFGKDDTAATVEDENLKSKVIDLACWELIKLSNPNIDLKLLRTCYEDAIDFFNSVKKSQLAPDGWPYKKDDTGTAFNEGSMVSASYNKKQRHRW